MLSIVHDCGINVFLDSLVYASLSLSLSLSLYIYIYIYIYMYIYIYIYYLTVSLTLSHTKTHHNNVSIDSLVYTSVLLYVLLLFSLYVYLTFYSYLSTYLSPRKRSICLLCTRSISFYLIARIYKSINLTTRPVRLLFISHYLCF